MGQQSTAQRIMAWILNVAVTELIGLNIWLVHTVMAHDKSIAVLSVGVQARLDSIVAEQLRQTQVQQAVANELKELNEVIIRHMARSENQTDDYGNQVKGKASIH